MIIRDDIKQRSYEWHTECAGSIGGTRFGQVIGGKKNRLVYELANEILNEGREIDDYVNDDMQFGIDNEPIARQLYSERSGIEFIEVGLIKSLSSTMHHASPDGLFINDVFGSVALEIKCTMDGSIHMQRYFEGVESNHMPQIKNYFAVSDRIKEVHWVSYCPFRPERPLVIHIFKAEDYRAEIMKARVRIDEIEQEVTNVIQQFTF